MKLATSVARLGDANRGLSAEILVTTLSETTTVPTQDQRVRSAVEPKASESVKVSIVIPAFNEAERLGSRLECVEEFFGKVIRGTYEFIVVTDGCTDETFGIAKHYAERSRNFRVLRFHKRLGKGGALIEALDVARGETVVLLDADNSVPPESVLKLVEATKHCDLAIGSRYVKEACLYAREPFLRYSLGRAFNAYARLMFWSLRGMKDTQCGAKAVRRRVIQRLREDLFITDFVFDLDLIVSALNYGFVVKEIGIEWEHVEKGSKVSMALVRLVLLMGFSTLRLRIYYSRCRVLLQADGMRRIAGFLWSFATK